MQRHDAIVLGLGAMGSAAAYQFARRGARVLGFDRDAPPHANGSSHGDTRITRLAIGEGDHYVPLARRAHELWREMEAETGRTLMTTTGGLVLSSPGETAHTHVDGFFRHTVAAAEKFGVAHDRLDACAIRERFAPFKVRDNEFGYFEHEAGFLRPEACVAAQLELAERHGAQLRRNTRVLSWQEERGGIRVETDEGVHYADKLVVAAGAWLPELLGADFARLFRIYRQVQFWFDVEAPVAAHEPSRFPVFIWELQDAPQPIYGFPAIDGQAGGIKIATEDYETTTSSDRFDRSVSADETAAMYANYVAPYFHGVGSRCIKAAPCLYTVTPDAGFVIDWQPGSERVLIASACSGHGFKHSATIGEILAELARDGRTRFDISPFRFARFS